MPPAEEAALSVVRSGLSEARHEGSVAVVDLEGRVIAGYGDLHRPFYFRSAAKPVQAAVCQRLGAGLGPEALAVAASSHNGEPVHLAYVAAMLGEAGLSEHDLGCPPDWPLARSAADRLVAVGHRRPRRIWHNCSGKHAAMLRACRRQGWDLSGYLRPEHPLQQAIAAEMVDLAGAGSLPAGVDGCGAPVFRGTATSVAAVFARLVSDPRLEEVSAAMRRFPALVSGREAADAQIAIWLGAAAKRGAEGCLAAGLSGRGAVAVKIWDGSNRAAEVAMGAALEQMGWVAEGIADRFHSALHRPVMGGGRPVGRLEATFRLDGR